MDLFGCQFERSTREKRLILRAGRYGIGPVWLAEGKTSWYGIESKFLPFFWKLRYSLHTGSSREPKTGLGFDAVQLQLNRKHPSLAVWESSIPYGGDAICFHSFPGPLHFACGRRGRGVGGLQPFHTVLSPFVWFVLTDGCWRIPCCERGCAPIRRFLVGV